MDKIQRRHNKVFSPFLLRSVFIKAVQVAENSESVIHDRITNEANEYGRVGLLFAGMEQPCRETEMIERTERRTSSQTIRAVHSLSGTAPWSREGMPATPSCGSTRSICFHYSQNWNADLLFVLRSESCMVCTVSFYHCKPH